MKEWHRTILLVLLLAIGVGFLAWTQHVYDARFTDLLR